MSKLEKERKRIEERDFSHISEDEHKRMLKIMALLRDDEKLHSQIMLESFKTVKTVNPALTNSEELETGVAMVQATVAHTIHFLIDNNYLEYRKRDSE